MSFAGVEVINNERARQLAAANAVYWYKGPQYPALATALGEFTSDSGAELTDNFSDPTQAPWYDPDLASVCNRFFGVYGLLVTNVYDSTQSVPITQNASDGGVIGYSRKGTRQVTYRVTLLAQGRDALEYGRNWLHMVLESAGCEQVEDCGRGDVLLFSEVPATTADAVTYSRFLKYSEKTSGPVTTQEFSSRNNIYGYEAEFTLTSEKPFIYGPGRNITLTVDTALALIQDSPINWLPYPSAELVTVNALMTNLARNPSGESTTAGFAAIPGASGTAAVTSVAPSTTTNFGSKLLKTTWTVASTAAGGGCSYTMTAGDVVPGSTYSFGFGHVKSSIANELQISVAWYTAAAALISTTLGTATAVTAGAINTIFSLANQLAPAQASYAVISIISVTGGSFAEWSIASYLEVDGLMINLGAALQPYFDGDISYPVSDTTLNWLGTAELSQSTAQVIPVIARNANINPSVELATTNWAATAATVSGTSAAAYFTTGQSALIAALGTHSFGAAITGNSSTSVSASVSTVVITNLASITAIPSTKLVQLSVWAAAVILAGTSSALASFGVTAQFLNASNAQVGSTQTLTADARGLNVYSTPKLAIPATATQVKFFITVNMTWTSGSTDATNSDVRLYADSATIAYFGGV